MAEDAVEKHVQAARMGLIDEFAGVLHGAELRIDLEVIAREITRGIELQVNGRAAQPLLRLAGVRIENRRQPDGVHAQALDVVQ